MEGNISKAAGSLLKDGKLLDPTPTVISALEGLHPPAMASLPGSFPQKLAPCLLQPDSCQSKSDVEVSDP